ncbi:MAG: AlbA family DNA-binding domain-containing protein [Candidatus Cyclobacteriaceae bacterium M2_1C_046]
MDLREVKKLAGLGESQQVEFKKKAAFPDKIVKEVVAFANSDGGWLLLGVDDDGNLSGLKFPEEEKGVLDQSIKKLCKPFIKFTTYVVPLNQKKSIVAYEVPKSNRKPHKVIQDGFPVCYVRVEDRSVKASREVQEIIRRQKYMRDMPVQYGDKEQVLMEYLQEHQHITLSEFQRVAGISKKQASRTLVHLVLANILDVEPLEKGDKYFLHSSF